MSITMNTVSTIPFPTGTPETLIVEALDSLPLFHRVNETNLGILELNVINELVDLKEKLGNKVFSKLLQSRYPLTAKEIAQKLGMAELKQNLEDAGLLNPTTLEALLQIGTEGCAALAKGSAELATTLISKVFKVAGVTIPTLRALVRRENKGFNPLPSREEIAGFQPTTLITITKPGRQKNWVAEVIDTPDILGRVQVRLVKTNRKKTLFWWEIELHQLTTPNLEEEVPPASLPPIIKQFVLQDTDGKYGGLSENDVESVRDYAETCARQDATEDTGLIAIKWKHLLEAVERFNLVPVESVLEILESVPPASSEPPALSESPAPPSQKLIKDIAWTRKQLVALQEEIDKCVEWETKGLLKQKQLHAQLRLDKALNALCGEVVQGPVDVDESVDLGPASEIIAQLETERDSLLNQIEKLTSQLHTHLDAPALTDGIGPVKLQGSGDVVGPVDHVQAPATEIIAKLETERDSLLHEINNLKNKLQTGSTGTPTPAPNNLDYQFEPVTQIEQLKPGDCIRIGAPNRDLKFGDVVVEITEFGEIKTQWFGTLNNKDLELGWKFEKVVNPLHNLTTLPSPQPISEDWKQLDGPLYEIVEMVNARGGDVRLEPVKGCKILQHPTPSDKWYRFLTPTGHKIAKSAIDGEWVKEQSLVDCELDF